MSYTQPIKIRHSDATTTILSAHNVSVNLPTNNLEILSSSVNMYARYAYYITVLFCRLYFKNLIEREGEERKMNILFSNGKYK